MSAARRPQTILVVEDDPSTRDIYRQALAAAGYAVVAVSDGLDALRRMETEVPDVVVLDLMLPRLPGRDVYEEMRALPATRTTPVVVVTGADLDAYDANQFHTLLRKPIFPDTLVAAVDQALARRPAGAP